MRTVLLTLCVQAIILAAIYAGWRWRGRVQPKPAPLGTGTVTTPEVPQAPKGNEWTQLATCNTVGDLDALDMHARQHGFGPTGQLRKAIAAKRETLV